MVLTQWSPALRSQAERLLAALEESSFDQRAHWRELLENALATA